MHWLMRIDWQEWKTLTLGFVDAVGSYTLLNTHALVAALRRPPHWKLIMDQLYTIGVLSLPVVAITGFSTGMVLAAQSFFQLADKGLSGATGLMVAKAMVTELGPTLTGFMITGRVGAAMCAELGTMKVTEQVDALQSLAANPLRYLVAPRLMAGTLMMPPLTAFSIAMGVFGGYLVAVFFFGMTGANYWDPIPEHVTDFDYVSGLVKSLIFGIIIVTICCFKGMTTQGGAAGVGRATTNSVVICYSIILVVNFFLTLALNLIHTSLYGEAM
jgi:phospholipid/cholesterol/gamma-HCH transport system permease protein